MVNVRRAAAVDEQVRLKRSVRLGRWSRAWETAPGVIAP